MNLKTAVTADVLPEALKHCFSNEIVPFVTSAPGLGKSMIMEDVARSISTEKELTFYMFMGNSNHSKEEMEGGFGFIDLRVNMMTQADLYGLPTFTDDKQAYKFARPDMIPQYGQGIIFVDELPQATPSVMGGLSEMFLNHRIGNHIIPDGWKVGAAGNRMKDRAATNRIPTHIKDRMNDLPLLFSLEPFVAWCTKNRVHPAIVAFAKYRPSILDSFDPKLDINCTPRSMVQAAKHLDTPDTIRFQLLVGSIGEGPATELEGFLRIYKELPDIQYIIDNPETAPVSEKLDILYALTTALGMRATCDNLDILMLYVMRIKKPEFRVSFIKQALLNDDEIIGTSTFSNFMKKHKNVLVT